MKKLFIISLMLLIAGSVFAQRGRNQTPSYHSNTYKVANASATTGNTIWDAGGRVEFTIAVSSIYITSDSDNDWRRMATLNSTGEVVDAAVTGIGAWQIKVWGRNNQGNEHSEVVTMLGTTAVMIIGSSLRAPIDKMEVYLGASGGNAYTSGNIWAGYDSGSAVGKPGRVLGMIPAGERVSKHPFGNTYGKPHQINQIDVYSLATTVRVQIWQQSHNRNDLKETHSFTIAPRGGYDSTVPIVIPSNHFYDITVNPVTAAEVEVNINGAN